MGLHDFCGFAIALQAPGKFLFRNAEQGGDGGHVKFRVRLISSQALGRLDFSLCLGGKLLKGCAIIQFLDHAGCPLGQQFADLAGRDIAGDLRLDCIQWFEG